MKKNCLLFAAAAIGLCACQTGGSSSVMPSASSEESTLSEASSESSLLPEKEDPNFYFLGSSVTYGHTTGGISFVEMLPNFIRCKTKKSAVSGTTLTDTGSTSYVQRMIYDFDPEDKIEHMVVQLSTNDISQNKPFGEVSDSFDLADFDTKTVIGAMEYIIAYAQEAWECEVSFYTNIYYGNSQYEALIAKLYELQEKWGIGIVDYYFYVGMEPLSETQVVTYKSDEIHPNSSGYRWMAEIMAQYLKTAYEARYPGYTI